MTSGRVTIWLLFAAIASAQPDRSDAGVPVTDPLVIEKCGTCHTRDERGNMQRISWARTTPEGWQDVLKRMLVLRGVSITPADARSILKYLSASHGLAPEEAKAVLYEPERRIHEETDLPGGKLQNSCTRCHTLARALSWRRSLDEWKKFADAHAARYKTPNEETVEYLAKAAPLHTAEWDSWSTGERKQNLSGRWLVTTSILGHGKFAGDMLVESAGGDEFTTRVTLTSLRDGSTIVRTGRSAVYGGYAWRGRSKGTTTPSAAPDDLGSEAREVLWIAPGQSTAEGRWFWGQYQEFGFDVKLQRASANPAIVLVDPTSLKQGSQANRVRLIGHDFPAEVTPTDLNFGPGVVVRRIVSHTASEVIAEVDVSADTAPGKRWVALRDSVLPAAIAIYDRVDYLKVTPESALATFGDAKHPRGYQQFEAIGYQRGADGKARTADDVELGAVDVNWSLEVFYATEGANTDFIGKVSDTGLLMPASISPGTNFDVWVVATAKDEAKGEKDKNGKPLVAKSYLVVTIPMYTFEGHQYVRDLDKWVDAGPVAKAQEEKQ